ncbi:germination protein, Ger(x)C family [Paenibacillus sp. UNCCL117]|uniref:Ger(x)C family spore germination protein n=1 Tax=unclassified Paenibacillus TaxID=185978 RepID=UPI00088E516B|nr:MULTISPECIES: Ger(x)C family spore germination protein [unclassified Paenibacillus]SDD97183.1 germination protein, Ger(x)C family [Paenibacillus sp. cl123]SFW56244.1 germination protein, Ger(x)C family [Paenibacillus sp. UNCCL117]
MKPWSFYIKLQLIVAVLLVVPGCWDYKELTYLIYTTSFGIDYKDDQYTVYLQALNFNDLAKQEGGDTGKSYPILVGSAKGETLTDAIFQLYRSEQMRIYWGHVSAVVLSKNAVKHADIKELVDFINRYREIRYNVWLYATEEPIERLFNLDSFFGMTAYQTILMNPEDSYQQYSDIKPIYLVDFLADYLERGRTAMLPVLSSAETEWKEGGKASRQMKLKGAYFFHDRMYKGSLLFEEMMGKRYLDKKMSRLPVTLHEAGKTLATLVVHVKDCRVDYRIEGGKVKYTVKLKATAFIEELYKNMEESSIIERVKKDVDRQIRTSFQKGLDIHADIYNLNDDLFRYHHEDWKTYIAGKPVKDITELETVDLELRLLHSGKYKNRVN